VEIESVQQWEMFQKGIVIIRTGKDIFNGGGSGRDI
jgi:hypothetical protein